MDKYYPKAYKEVAEILKNVDEIELKKIPGNLLNMFYKKMDNEYEFIIDITKPFEKIEIMNETKAILANIYRDYWAASEQKARILAFQANELLKIEQRKKQKINTINLSENIVNNKTKDDEKIEITEQTALMIVNNEKIKWYKKIIYFFRLRKVFSSKVELNL